MEKAIELANKEGGYFWHIDHWREAVLDPKFFQSLGKSLGWEEKDKQSLRTYKMSGGGGNMLKGMYQWNKYWHRFIDHLAEGKDAEEFFASLLKI